MSFFQWRRFNFFDISKDVDAGKVSSQLGEDASVICSTSGRGRIVMGDSNVHKINFKIILPDQLNLSVVSAGHHLDGQQALGGY